MARRVRHKSFPPPRRETVRIERIGSGGDGVAEAEGAPLYVPLTAPGDVAIVEIRGDRGRLLELVDVAPERAQPVCVHYGECGGCALQHIERDAYRRWKRAQVVDALTRSGLKDATVADVVALPPASRRRAVFAFDNRAGLFGFNARRSSRIVDTPRCEILGAGLRARFSALKSLAALTGAAAGDMIAACCDNGLDIRVDGKSLREPRGGDFARLIERAEAAGAIRLAFGDDPVFQAEPPVIDCDGVFAFPPSGAFMQASREGERALAQLVTEALDGRRKVADLFCGWGAFALRLAAGATVHGVDSDAASVEALAAAAAAAQRAGGRINPVTAERRNLFERPLTAGELKGFDAVVFDPPRAGARAQAEELAKSAVPVIVGVSCNPSTFARDAAILSQGGYRLECATPVDQFVWAAHVEVVGVFCRRSA